MERNTKIYIVIGLVIIIIVSVTLGVMLTRKDSSEDSNEVKYTVTVKITDEGNKYFINGTQQKPLTFEVGKKYIFSGSDLSSHPLRFSTTADGTHDNGTEYSTDTVYSTDTEITVTDNTPKNLYYYCSRHSGMGGDITVN